MGARSRVHHMLATSMAPGSFTLHDKKYKKLQVKGCQRSHRFLTKKKTGFRGHKKDRQLHDDTMFATHENKKSMFCYLFESRHVAIMFELPNHARTS